jgi:hypothetical protein
VGVGVRLALVLATPPIAGHWLGHGTTWSLLFDREPGLAAWLLVALFVGMLRNVARFSWLRGPSSQLRKLRLLLRK